MTKFKDARILGVVGAVLMLIGGYTPIGAIIGLVLIFLAVKYISTEAKDETIFNNYLMYFIFIVFGLVATAMIIFYTFGGIDIVSIFESANITDFESFWNFIQPYLNGIIIGLVVGWILFIVSAFYLRKSYDSIAKHTKVHMFSTAAFVYLIGAVLVIIGIGFILIFIAEILTIIAFWRLPESLPKAKG